MRYPAGGTFDGDNYSRLPGHTGGSYTNTPCRWNFDYGRRSLRWRILHLDLSGRDSPYDERTALSGQSVRCIKKNNESCSNEKAKIILFVLLMTAALWGYPTKLRRESSP